MWTRKVSKIWNGIFVLIFFGKRMDADRIVMTTNGPLQGVTVSTDGLQIEAFLGVPYAEPPTGHLRFKKPVQKAPWTGLLHATSQPPPCIQNVTIRHYWEPAVENMTEDCLFLNMWVPYSKEKTELKTIIVFVHGGAFNIGSGNMPLYDGTNLARFGDVIVVNLNYRVGVMGFLFASIEDANGNMGIFDQILAMRWVKDNAKSFGGDPDSIVLMGESAGAVISSSHLISPLTRHLFKRIIMQSGAGILPIISADNVRLFEASQRIASLVGCADGKFAIKDNPRSVLHCLQRIPAHELAAAEGRMMEDNKITFPPRVGDSYLPKLPVQSLQEGDFLDIDMLIGVNENEGPFFLAASAPLYFGDYGGNQVEGISRTFAYSMVYDIFTIIGQKKEEDIAEQYINTVQIDTTDSYLKAIAMSLGDYLINCNAVFHAELHSMRNPVYFYVFSRRASTSPLAEWMGTTHFDEMQYVFGNPLFGNFTPEETEFSRRMMARWISFAKTGNPNIPGEKTWPMFTYGDPQYLQLDNKDYARSRPDNNRCEFWRDRYQAQVNDEIVRKIKGPANSGILLASCVLCTIMSALITLHL